MRNQRKVRELGEVSPAAETLEPPETAATTVHPPHETACRPHELEQAVRRTLLSEPSLRFSSLVVRRIPRGVCLEGVLEAEGESPDVCGLARQVSGVEAVLNHLLVCCPPGPPRKG